MKIQQKPRKQHTHDRDLKKNNIVKKNSDFGLRNKSAKEEVKDQNVRTR